ncbi:hypothetical protein C8Q74DRAFT_912783 [Fomes fomentarius]|nr:hypothetical protein C8Q74DRAFT_912783 [Fomes fomentarius]
MPAEIPPAAPVAALPPPPPAAAAAPAAPVETAPALYWEDVPSGPRISKPSPRFSSDWITSHSIREALYGKPFLTEKEQVRAIKNLLSLQDIVDAELAADTSTTTIDTVPDNQGRDGYPDLMLCHTHTVAIPEPDDRKKLFGWNRRMQRKVVHHCFPLILEVKACIDRTMQDEKWQTRASDALAMAEEELYEYLQTCFMRDLCARSVIAMSAAGPYWRWIRVKREQIDLETLMIDTEKLQAMLRRFRAATIFSLGTKESDGEFTRLRDKGLIPIIEKHHWYKSTMVPNPQR